MNSTMRHELTREQADGIRASIQPICENVEGLRHSANIEHVPYGDLRNGDIIWIAGYAMVVGNIRSYPQTDNSPDIIRFNGTMVDPDTDVTHTGYDGGTYGAHAEIIASIVNRDLVRKLLADGAQG